MFKFLKNNRAQVVSAENILVLFVVLGVMSVMTVYFKRAIQARVHDARDAVLSSIDSSTQGYYGGPLYYDYEPYYTNAESESYRSSTAKVDLLPGVHTGIFRKKFSDVSAAQTKSTTAPPKDAY